MRRSDRQITDPGAIEEILHQAKVLHLGLMDGARPYVVPLHYGYELVDGKLTLYMHCAREGHKLDLIRANPNVFVEIDTGAVPISGGDVACRYGAAYSSLMGGGTATIVEDTEEKIRALEVLMKTQTGRAFAMTPEMAQSVAVIRVVVPAFTAKAKPLPQ